MIAIPWFVLVAAGIALGYFAAPDQSQQLIDMLFGTGRDINGF